VLPTKLNATDKVKTPDTTEEPVYLTEHELPPEGHLVIDYDTGKITWASAPTNNYFGAPDASRSKRQVFGAIPFNVQMPYAFYPWWLHFSLPPSSYVAPIVPAPAAGSSWISRTPGQ
jgi:hypothetical protein